MFIDNLEVGRILQVDIMRAAVLIGVCRPIVCTRNVRIDDLQADIRIRAVPG